VLVDDVSVGAVASYTFSAIAANHTIAASFAIDEFTITASAGTNGGISPSGSVAVSYGSTPSFTITPNTGYHIADVLVDDVSVGAVASYTFSAVATNHTIAASFAIDEFTITASAGTNGGISPSGSVAASYGSTPSFTITPNTGYHIADVLVDDVSVGAVASYTFSAVATNHTIAASFAIDEFTITASAGTNGGISPSGSVAASYGSTPSFTITPNTGYHIADVLVDDASVGAVASYTFSAIAANHTIAASFAIDEFTITASAGTNGGISPSGSVAASYGSTPSFTITPNTGYHIADVLVDGTSVGAVASYTFSAIAANHTIAASFAIDEFTITASAGTNGGISPSGSVAASYGSTPSFTITPNTGYHIADVLVDNASVGAVASYTFSAIAANHTIAASFAIDEFTITASAGTNGGISPSGSVAASYGSTPSFTITPNTGYHIADVLVDNVSVGAVASYTFSAVAANHTIAASFAIDEFTITASAGTNGGISPSGSVTASYGSTPSFTITPNTGYHISDVLVDDTSVGAVSSYTFSAVEANHTISASFAIDEFTITASAGTNGGISPSGPVAASYGSTPSFTITPNTGYHIADVLVDNVSVGAVASYTFSAVAANHTIAASFAIDEFTITASAGTNGGISPSGSVTASYGSTPSFTITPNTGYHIADVLVDNASVGAVASYTFSAVAANHTISASFAIDEFTITASAGTNGGILPSGPVAASYGSTPSFTITPNTGYHIADVLVDNASVGAVASYTFSAVTANHTISASFAIDEFTITASAGTNGGISPSGSVAASYGSTPSFTITPNTGYHIADVLVDNVSVGAVASYTFSAVAANHTIAASFAIDEFTITASAGTNGGISPSGSVAASYGSTPSFTITPNTGYHIADVLVDDASIGAVASYTFSAVAANHTILASFAINSYLISASVTPVSSGTVSGAGTYDHGSTVSLEATASPGYTFKDWTEAGNVLSSNPFYSFTATGARTLVANFTVNIVANVSPNSAGTTSGAGSYAPGSTVIVTATPNPGFTFVNWTEGGNPVSANASYSFSVTGPRTLVANFLINVSVTANPADGGNVTGGGSFAIGTNVTVAATPNVHFSFKNWTEGSTIVSTSASFSFSVNAPRNLVANFVNNPPSVSSLSISGDPYVCKTLTGHYIYHDDEGDKESGSQYQWYRGMTPGDAVLINGATSITYTVTDADINKFIFFRVTPKAETGASTGAPTLSGANSAIITKPIPRVTLSTSKSTICQKEITSITFSFVGTQPYTLVYTDGTNEHTIKSQSDVLTIPVSKGGIYKGDTLTDKNSCPTTGLSSTLTITVNPLPVVDITGLNNAYSLAANKVKLGGTPSGGTFKGDGVTLSAGVYYFDPSVAGVAGSPHPVVYEYTSPTTGCSNTDTVKVSIIDADAFISGLRSESKYCSFDAPFLITGGNSASTIGTFSISGGIGLTDNGDNTATIDPSLLKSTSTYTVSYSYFNNVSLTIAQNFTVEQLSAPLIQGISQSLYCSNNSRIQLTVGNQAYSGGVFSGNGVGRNSNNTYYFDPSTATPGRASVKFLYSYPYGCRVSDSIVTQVSKAPLARFEIQNSCWRGDSTTFINLTNPVSSINFWEWDYGDVAAPSSKNISHKFEQKYLYPLYGDYNVKLTAKNVDGCTDVIQKNVHLGDIPDVNFDWKSECFVIGAPIKFMDKTIFKDSIVKYNWIVQDGPNLIYQFNTKDIQHSYPSLNNYNVKLEVTNETGCKDSISKSILLRPIYSLKDTTYLNTFETGNGYWYPDSTSANNWSWAKPNMTNKDTAYSESKSYCTNFSVARRSEQLIVTSPCFDFTGVTRPFIQMWINSNSNQEEGAVLQYAVDTVKQWHTIGTVGLGINWYNDSTLDSYPGNQRNGWSGTFGWTQARNNLDMVNGKNLIRFRMVYGSASGSASKGFAFDNVFIGKRSKVALLEQFTNLSGKDANKYNSDVDNILQAAGTDAVGIQYHTSFPGPDSLNVINQSDPGARVLYYGVANVPECFLDGGIDPKFVYDFKVKYANIKDVNSRILQDADYSISIVNDKNISPSVSGTVVIKALKDIDYREVSIYVAVVEDIKIQTPSGVVSYSNVLKKLLPNAAGYAFNKSWAKNQEETINYSWPIQNVYNSNNLKVIVFVQDNSTKEVYQASIINVGTPVGIPDIVNKAPEEFAAAIYPNPARSLAHVSFAKELSSGFELILMDQSGKILKQMKLQHGISEAELEVSDLPDGLYFVRIINSKTGENKNLKLMVQ
jgi:hypothetical protein